MQRVVLFDIDGTMLIAGGAGKRAFFAAIEAVLGPLPADAEFDPRGRTDPALFDLAAQAAVGRPMTESERTSVTDFFVTRFPEELARAPSFRVLPGVLDLVRTLALDEQVYLGVQTGNFEVTAQHKLRRAGINHFFEFGGYASDHPERAEFIRIAVERASTLYGESFLPEQVVVIGDTPFDIAAASQHGFRTVAVETGGIRHAELSAAGADLVTADLSNIEAIREFIRA